MLATRSPGLLLLLLLITSRGASEKSSADDDDGNEEADAGEEGGKKGPSWNEKLGRDLSKTGRDVSHAVERATRDVGTFTSTHKILVTILVFSLLLILMCICLYYLLIRKSPYDVTQIPGATQVVLKKDASPKTPALTVAAAREPDLPLYMKKPVSNEFLVTKVVTPQTVTVAAQKTVSPVVTVTSDKPAVSVHPVLEAVSPPTAPPATVVVRQPTPQVVVTSPSPAPQPAVSMQNAVPRSDVVVIRKATAPVVAAPVVAAAPVVHVSGGHKPAVVAVPVSPVVQPVKPATESQVIRFSPSGATVVVPSNRTVSPVVLRDTGARSAGSSGHRDAAAQLARNQQIRFIPTETRHPTTKPSPAVMTVRTVTQSK